MNSWCVSLSKRHWCSTTVRERNIRRIVHLAFGICSPLKEYREMLSGITKTYKPIFCYANSSRLFFIKKNEMPILLVGTHSLMMGFGFMIIMSLRGCVSP